MLGRSLDFAPGTRYTASNICYCVLGRIAGKVSGPRYDDYVNTTFLSPAGTTRMQIGRTKPEERVAGEVRYYVFPDGYSRCRVDLPKFGQ